MYWSIESKELRKKIIFYVVKRALRTDYLVGINFRFLRSVLCCLTS
jgi:hypothetical protein